MQLRSSFIYLAPIASYLGVASAVGGFSSSCSNIHLVNGHDLQANCKRIDGSTSTYTLFLDSALTNNGGNLAWALNGVFSRTCSSCHLKSTAVLECSCTNPSGGKWTTAINLDERVTNDNGAMTVVF